MNALLPIPKVYATVLYNEKGLSLLCNAGLGKPVRRQHPWQSYITGEVFSLETGNCQGVLYEETSGSSANDTYACTTSRCNVYIMIAPAIRCYNPRTARSSNSLAPAVGPVDRGCAEGRKDDA